MGLFSGPKKDEPFEAAVAVKPVDRLPPRRTETVQATYGIEKAIGLMRSLPADNGSVELVVQVMKKTLESLSVNVDDIIADASRKQLSIEERIEQLQEEVKALETEIKVRQDETATLRKDHEETTRVKDRLMLAQKSPASDAGKDGRSTEGSSPKAGANA